jgi:hypothetical protein
LYIHASRVHIFSLRKDIAAGVAGEGFLLRAPSAISVSDPLYEVRITPRSVDPDDQGYRMRLRRWVITIKDVQGCTTDTEYSEH